MGPPGELFMVARVGFMDRLGCGVAPVDVVVVPPTFVDRSLYLLGGIDLSVGVSVGEGNVRGPERCATVCGGPYPKLIVPETGATTGVNPMRNIRPTTGPVPVGVSPGGPTNFFLGYAL